MKKLLTTAACIMTLALASTALAAPISFDSTAGDIDFAATRSAYDSQTNMDYYVFRAGSGNSGVATNSLGSVDWNYVLPNQIVTAYSGSMTVRVWDIDTSDNMQVFFDLGNGDRVFAGLLAGSNGGNISTWENAVATGTTSSLGGWSTTTFSLDPTTLAAIAGTSAFTLDLDVRNEASAWAAVVDFASLSLIYEPGAFNPDYPQPVPEPSTMALLGLGLVGVGLARKRFGRG